VLDGFDVVLDGTDHIATKLALHDACRARSIDYVFASAIGWSGQAMAVRGDEGACLRCAFPEAAQAGVHPTCDAAGVLGPVLGCVAARQVRLALEGSLPGVLHVYDGWSDEWLEVAVAPRPGCAGCRPALRRTDAARAGAESGGDATASAPSLDLRGIRCPITYIETRRSLDSMARGERLWVRFDSDESARRVPAGAEAAGHRVVSRRRGDGEHFVLLERGA